MRHVLCISAVSPPQWGMSAIVADVAAVIPFCAAFLVALSVAEVVVVTPQTLVEVLGMVAYVRLVPADQTAVSV